jgi:hypothetical protein
VTLLRLCNICRTEKMFSLRSIQQMSDEEDVIEVMRNNMQINMPEYVEDKVDLY